MSKSTARLVVLVGLGLAFWLGAAGVRAQWKGADDVVEGKAAAQAGRSARPPLDGIDTSSGDLALFAFMIAGLVGGFVVGYYFRELFPPRRASPPASGLVASGESRVASGEADGASPSASRKKRKRRGAPGDPPHV